MNIRILCVGDVVGLMGRTMFAKHIHALRVQHKIDLVIVNGENCADDGRGIGAKHADFLKASGADIITTGNHVWAKKDIYSYIAEHKDFLLRPANFPSETPGIGLTIITAAQIPIAVINLQGRVFMRELLECPFKTADSLLTYARDKARVIIVDFHAETTAEKAGLANYLDGRISGIFGTHTHVQTADERILPQGTAFITDVGMVGARDSMIGMKKEPIIQNFITQMPVKFQVETEGPALLTGAIIEVDSRTGKARSIERIAVIDDAIIIESKSE